MFQKKYVLIGGGILGAAALVLSGFLLGHDHHSLQSAQASLDGVTTSTGQSDGTPNSVPLNQTPAPASNNGGLSVSSNGAANSLGQISPSGGSSASSGSGQGSSGGSSSSSGSSPVDPSTFGQYDKYKDSTNALFGDVQVGNGATLGANQQAAVYYKGWLTNGSLFDESRAGSDGKVQPFTFTMGAHQVISGWEESLSGMKVGGTRLIVVPPSVGYGSTGQGSIPPNSVLVFEVQLVAVQ